MALALSSACRHPGIALAIAVANFREDKFGAAILLYLVVSTVISALYTLWQRKATAAT